MSFYADTSFLVSLYLIDANSVAARQLMHHLKPTLYLTEFGAFELKNAIRSVAFRRTITITDAEAAIRSVEHDSAGGFLVPAACLWDDVFHTAEGLSHRHTHLVGCRALDILQLASAVVLGCTDFLTFDQRQARLAQQTGLATHP